MALLCPLIAGMLFTSCLPEAEETELSSTVAILSFSINDLKTKHTVTLDNGKDSTYTTIMDASSIPFTIDQTNGLIYNRDSIAYGTNVTRVITNLSTDGYVYYYKDGEKTNYKAADSIDFTNPVKFTVISHDEMFSRDYLISINVHQTDPNSTYWEQLKESNFQAGLFAKQQALLRGKQIYVFGQNANGECFTTYTDVDNGTQWSDPSPWNGVTGEADCSSAILFNESFYILAGGILYQSADGINWQVTSSESVECLLAVTSENTSTAWGLINGAFAYSQDMGTWNTCGQATESGMNKRIASFSQPLRTNTNIHRTIVIGTDTQSTDTCAQVWSKLSTENRWTEVVPVGTNIYGCPNLENLAVIRCHNRMYAFGGKSIGERHVPIEAFSACYESRDNGVTWRVRNNGFSMHPSFAGSTDTFSTVVDDKERVWIIWSSTGEIWRATWTNN